MTSFFNHIISPERDRIARRPLDVWIADLDKQFIHYLTSSQKERNHSEFEVILNNLSLICFYMGEHDLSRSLCQTAQSFFFDLYVTKGNDCPNKFGVIQPWINLIRLDRFLKRFDNAEQRLKELIKKDEIFSLAGHPLSSQQISGEARGLIGYCYVDETVKIGLAKKAYTNVLSFVGELPKRQKITNEQILFLLEARSIACLHTPEAPSVPFLLRSILQEIPVSEKAVFYLKFVHWMMHSNQDAQARTYLEENLLSCLLLTENEPLYKLRFWLNVARTCKSLGMTAELFTLSQLLLPHFKHQEDDLSVFEVATLLEDTDGFKSTWQQIIAESTYGQAKKGFSTVVPWWVGLGRQLSLKILSFMNDQLHNNQKANHA